MAAAPAVDVLAGGKPVIEGLTNPNGKSLEVPAGSVEAAVALAGTTDPVLGPQTLDVAEGSNTVVYAWGSAEQGNLALATQSVQAMPSAPGGVPTGDTRLPEDSGVMWYALGTGALVLGAGAVSIARRRNARARV